MYELNRFLTAGLASPLGLLTGCALILFLSASCAGRPDSTTVSPPGSGSQGGEAQAGSDAPIEAERSFVILSINDVYRLEGIDGGSRGGLARVATLRRQLEEEDPDLLFLHAGDFLFPSLLSNTFKGRQMVDTLNRLDGAEHVFDERTVVVFGNHEFDRNGAAGVELLNRRLEESEFRWLHSNIQFKKDPETGLPSIVGQGLAEQILVESGGVKVGLFGLTLSDEFPDYVESFSDPIETARRQVKELRARGAEVVVALTHQSMDTDLALLNTLGAQGPDLVIGGHEHQQQHKQAAGRWVLKADADAVTAWIVRVTVDPDGRIRVDKRLEALGPIDPEPNAQLMDRIEYWRTYHGELFCGAMDPPRQPDCLDEQIGLSRTKLIAEELEIRKFETNLGNWILDQALEAFSDQGAQLALMNSGGLRLNQNLPPGPLLLRHIKELLPFAAEMSMVDITGATLLEAVQHAVSQWPGNGHFLQISGFAFRHDPSVEDGAVRDLTLLTGDGPRLVSPDETLRVVVNDFLLNVDRGQDGFTMLRPDHRVTGSPRVKLEELLLQGLAAAGEQGIEPRVEGRICVQAVREGPCLALTDE